MRRGRAARNGSAGSKGPSDAIGSGCSIGGLGPVNSYHNRREYPRGLYSAGPYRIVLGGVGTYRLASGILKITQEVRAFAIDQAGRRCECTRANCRHHLSGARCKRGLRGDGWKVYWRKESGGATRENIEAWCLECFDNNFEAPRETVALLAAEIFGYSRLLEEDERRALTLKSVLRDSAERAAKECRGRVVLDRFDDDLLLEFATSQDAVKAARRLYAGFEEIARRLELPVPDICGAIHEGEVTRWRNGFLAGDTVEIATGVRSAAGVGQVLLTEAAAAPIRGKVELEPVVQNPEMPPPATEDPGKPQRGLGEMWAIRL